MSKPTLTQHSSGFYLLPCPLCGENPICFANAIECRCGLMLADDEVDELNEDIIELWNQRAGGGIRQWDDPPEDDLLAPVWLICPTRIIAGHWNEGWVLDKPLEIHEEPIGWTRRQEAP